MTAIAGLRVPRAGPAVAITRLPSPRASWRCPSTTLRTTPPTSLRGYSFLRALIDKVVVDEDKGTCRVELIDFGAASGTREAA